MELRPSLFWDSDVKTLDLEKHKRAIIERTMMRGVKEEFDALLQYYGKDTIREIALSARYLDKYTLSFCSAIFNVPITEFRCYKLAQLNPAHWDY